MSLKLFYHTEVNSLFMIHYKTAEALKTMEDWQEKEEGGGYGGHKHTNLFPDKLY